ncbi:MAG: hypothetical protein R3A46_16595 [Thermomicrobiales bacterium]
MRGLNGSTETVGIEVAARFTRRIPDTVEEARVLFRNAPRLALAGREHTLPGTIESHVARKNINFEAGEMLLLPGFRLPTIIHTRSANAE